MSALKTRGRAGLGWLRLLALAPAGLALLLLSRLYPAFAEWYALHIYRYLAGAMGTVSGVFPFSLMELFYPGLAAFVIWLVVRAARRCRRGGSPLREWLGALGMLGCTGAALLFVYAATFGVGYNRLSFAAYSGLEVRESTTEELTALCQELIEEANALSGAAPRNELGVTVWTEGDYALAVSARVGYDRLGEKYPVLALGGRSFGTPKPLLCSPLMSWTQISGVSFPFTMEANVNVDGPDFLIPATMMHEQTHLAGFMREDEANYIAYAACRESGNEDLAYSGTMLALIHSMNALYRADPERCAALRSTYNDGVDRDMAAQNAFLDAHEGRAAEISDAVNDAYLRANDQTDGVKSYGRMVDLLLADYRQRQAD